MKDNEMFPEQEWLRETLNTAGDVKLPASLSAEALFARMDAQPETPPQTGKVLRPVWVRWAGAAAALLVVAGISWGWQRNTDNMQAPEAAQSVKENTAAPDLLIGSGNQAAPMEVSPSTDSTVTESTQNPAFAPREPLAETDSVDEERKNLKAAATLQPLHYGESYSPAEAAPATLLFTLPEGITTRQDEAQPGALLLLCGEEVFGELTLFLDEGDTYQKLTEGESLWVLPENCVTIQNSYATAAGYTHFTYPTKQAGELHARFYRLQYDGYVIGAHLYLRPGIDAAEAKCDVLIDSLQFQK